MNFDKEYDLEGSPDNLVNNFQDPSKTILDSQSGFNMNHRKEDSNHIFNKKKISFDNIFQSSHLENQPSLDLHNQQDEKEGQCNLQSFMKNFSQTIKSPKFSLLYLIVLTIFLASSILQLSDTGVQTQKIANYVELGCQIFFTFVIIAKIIFQMEKQKFWMTLDIISNISGYIGIAAEEFSEEAERYIKVVTTLRLLFFIKESIYLKFEATNLINSLKTVGKILFPAAMFIFFYAVVGLYAFRDYQYSRCRDPSNKNLSSNWTAYTGNVYLCGQMSCPVVNGIAYQCLNPIDYGVTPSQSQLLSINLGNGLMRYNNIFYSLLTTFKQTFVTGSSRIMILEKQVTNQYFVLFYYLSFIYLLSYLYLNIFYGLMLSCQEEDDNLKDSIRNQDQVEIKIKKSKKQDMQTAQLKLSNNRRSQKMSKLKRLNSNVSQNIQNQSRMSNCISIMKPMQNQLISIKQESSQFDEIIDLQKKEQYSGKYTKNSTKKIKSKIIIAFNNNDNGKNMDFLQKKIIDSQSMSSKISIESQEDNYKKYSEVMRKYYIVNHIIVTLCAINITMDYQGQSIESEFITDCIDFSFYCLYLFQLLFRFYIHQKYVPDEPIQKIFKLDIILFLFVTCGIVYEAIIATDTFSFFNAQTGMSSALRCLKYFRLVFIILDTPFFKEARIILASTFQAVYTVRYFTLLWLLSLLIFSIMGVHMFHDKTKVNSSGQLDMQTGEAFPISFQGIYNGIIFTVFVFFNQEWDYFMFQQYLGAGPLIVIWQLITICLGLTILSKYFMALLMKELGDKLDQKSQQLVNEDQNKQDQLSIMSSSNQIFNSNRVTPVLETPLNLQQQLFQRPLKKSSPRQKQLNINLKEKRISFLGENAFQVISNKKISISKLRQTIEGISQEKEKSPAKLEQNFQLSKFKIFSFYLTSILKHSIYTYARCGVVLLSCVGTAILNPQVNPTSLQYKIINYIFIGTDIFFALQIFLSMVAYGILFDKKSYFRRSYMNWINIFISIIELLNYLPSTGDGTTLDHLLCLRVLRVFVFIQLKYFSDKDMRLTIVAFTKLIPKVVNLLLITGLMYGFFAIILVKLYKNDFYYCDSYYSSSKIQTKQDCLDWGGSWVQRKMNVSNFLNSVLYLFLVATTQGWSTQVIQAASLSGEYKEPSFGSNIQIQAFFSAFFFFGNMIMLNVFIGLSLYNFKKIKQEVIGESRLTKDQKMWLSIKSQIYRLKPSLMDEPSSYLLGSICHKVTHSKAYKIVNIIFFLIFIINMCQFQTNQSDQKNQILTLILYIFYGIFCFQYVLNWLSYGIRIVKQSTFWFQTLGFLYAIIFTIVMMNDELNDDIDAKLHRIMRAMIVAFLAVRYFSILKDIQFVRKTINSLITILPQTYNILLLIVIILFVYAVIGMELFSYLKVSSQLNAFDQNYISLDKALYALIKFSTMQSPIGQITDAASKIAPNSICFQINSYSDFQIYGRMGCGDPIKSYIFFLSFHLVYSLLLMSTLMAVIFDAYSQVRRQQESMVNKFQLEQVQNEWTSYDPQATGYISYRDFWMFTAKLMKIYNVNKQEIMSHQTKQSFLKSLKVSIYEDQHGVLSFQFHQVIEALTRIVIDQKVGHTLNTQKADKLFQVKKQDSQLMKKSFYDSSHVLTLIMLKSGLKVWRNKANNGDGMIKALLKQAKMKAGLQKKNTDPENIQQVELTIKRQKILSIDKINFQNQQSQAELKNEKSAQNSPKMQLQTINNINSSLQQVKKGQFQVKSTQRSRMQIINNQKRFQDMQIQEKLQLHEIGKNKQKDLSKNQQKQLKSSDR